jgi:flotillin
MIIPAIIGGVGLLVFLFLITYKVVNPNEAHIIVFMGRGRKVYAPRLNTESKAKTSYFFVPFLMKRQILPLTNVKMDINDIHLNDIEVAPFVCDVIAWINIEDAVRAAERLDVNHRDGIFGSLREDLINIVQAVARAVAMKQEILDIMRDRQTFSTSVSNEVDGVLDSWGINLVNLEVNDIRDDEDKESGVISDYEAMRKVNVHSKSRQEIAKKNREAIEVEQENRKAAEIAQAKSEEEFKKKQIERDKNVGIADQEKAMKISEMEQEANIKKVAALQKLEVGKATVQKEAVIQVATGEAEAVRVKGEKEADVVKLRGEAEGKAIEAKGTAEATAKNKMAEAMQKFNDAATNIEKIRAWIEVQKAKYESLGKALSAADLKLVTSGKGGNLFGFDLNAETGADLGQMLESMDISDISKIIDQFKSKAGK